MLDSVVDFKLGTTQPGKNSAGQVINRQLEGRTLTYDVTEEVATAFKFTARINGRRLEIRVFRNESGGALLPGAVFKTDPALGIEGTGKAAGPSAADDRLCYVVDPALPAEGVADGDLFWGIVRGPTRVNLNNGTIAAGVTLKAGVAVAVADTLGSGLSLGTAIETVTAADSIIMDMHPDWE